MIDARLWKHPQFETLEDAILCTIAYADVFDYPLTLQEIQRYLIGMNASLATVEEMCYEQSRRQQIARHGVYFSLPGRQEIVKSRQGRARVAAEAWPLATYYGRVIAGLPFVSMVAVTGALAMDNMEQEGDIDYLIVTEPNRLWLCRAMIIQWVVKPAARRGITICPNYLLSEQALSAFEPNLFTAHEIVQMVPISGLHTYWKLCHLNGWAADFLPNGFGQPRRVHQAVPLQRAAALAAKPLLRLPVGTWLERWEMNRKIIKLDGQNGQGEAAFSADQCKGHFQGHGHHVRDALFQRLASLDRMPRRQKEVAR